MRVLWTTILVLVIDQVTKMLVYANMYRGQSIPLIGDWFRLTYTENPGMAFGLTFGPRGLVTVLSIAATLLIMYYMLHVREGYAPYRYSLAIILGGALGNIIDRVLYGMLLYGEPLFHGRVIDFIHFDIWRGYLPETLPLIGGMYVPLFPIWNVADMAIVCGVVGILVFQHRFHEDLERRAAAAMATERSMPPADAPADNAPAEPTASPTAPVNGRPMDTPAANTSDEARGPA